MKKLKNITPIAFLIFALALVGCSSSEKTDSNSSTITKLAQQDSTLLPYENLTGIRDDLRFDSTKYPAGVIVSRLNWENGAIRQMVIRPDSADKARFITAEWDKDGFLTKTRELSGRMPNGTSTTWYKSGSLETLANFKNGVLNDTLFLFWEDGSPKQIETYVDGKRNGIWYKFNEEGHLLKQGFFLDDSLDGDFTEWTDKGDLKFKGHYLNNKMAGEWEKFYPEGALRARAEYKDGKRNGENVVWDEGGGLLNFQFFIDDKEVPWPDSVPRPQSLAAPADQHDRSTGQLNKNSGN